MNHSTPFQSPRPHPSPRQRIGPLQLIAVALSALIALCAACSAAPTAGSTQAAAGIAGLPSTAQHVFVIAATASRNEPAPSIPQATRAEMLTAAEQHDDAFAVVVPPGGTAPRVFDLTPRRANGDPERTRRRQDLAVQNVAEVTRAVGALAAAQSEVDLLETLSDAVALLPRPATLVVLSSGLSTTGALDLRQVAWGTDPRDVVDDLREREFLPPLRGWHVVFAGIGGVAGDQPPVPRPQVNDLTGLWTAICQAGGAARCDLDSTATDHGTSKSRYPVSKVPVPEVTSVHSDGEQRAWSVPGLLFDFDSDELAPGTDDELLPVVAHVLDTGATSVLVSGYTDATYGSAQHNADLSRRRAVAVATRLQALGVPEGLLHSVGMGSTGTSREQETTGGVPDPEKVEAQRRVVITISPVTSTTTS